MRFIGLVVCVAVCASFVAATTIVDQRRAAALDVPHAMGIWKAARASDCRSPCPALNTLANHGLLPRDGRNIDQAMLKQALLGIYGLGPAFGTIFAHAATKKFATPATGKFSLCDLLINVHSDQQPSGQTGIEHSASVSRLDRPCFGAECDASQRSPSKDQIDVLLASSPTDRITLPQFMNARKALWDKSYTANPALKTDRLNTQEHVIANVEGCLLLGALSGNSNNGQFEISKSYATSFLLNEMLPVGWKPSAKPLGLPRLFKCLAAQGLQWAKSEVLAVVQLSKHWFGLSI